MILKSKKKKSVCELKRVWVVVWQDSAKSKTKYVE